MGPYMVADGFLGMSQVVCSLYLDSCVIYVVAYVVASGLAGLVGRVWACVGVSGRAWACSGRAWGFRWPVRQFFGLLAAVGYWTNNTDSTGYLHGRILSKSKEK